MRIPTLFCFDLFATCLMVSLSCYAYGQVAHYDNLGQQPVAGPKFDPGDRFIAQPFQTGPQEVVSSVIVNLYRNGSPTGLMNLEIWDDDAGIPGALVESVGSINTANLPGSPGYVAFDTSIELSPNSTYHLLLDSGSVPSSSSNSFRFGVATTDSGTNGAGKLLYQIPSQGRWVTVDSVLPCNGSSCANYWQVSVRPTTSGCDFNADGACDIKDLVRRGGLFDVHLESGSEDDFDVHLYDMNDDHVVNGDDLSAWLTNAAARSTSSQRD